MLLLAGLAQCFVPPGAQGDQATDTRAFSRHSVNVIALAAGSRSNDLSKYVSPSAQMSLGGGDVVGVLEPGIEGLRSLASKMNAATFAFKGWDYMSAPEDLCGRHSVEVDFYSADGKEWNTVQFQYDRGLLVVAKGWTRSRESGPVRVESH